MSDLFRIQVVALFPRAVHLRLQIIHRDEVTFPLSPSFAMMVIGDESLPSYETFRSWEQARSKEDECFSAQEHLVEIRLLQVRGLPREQGCPPAGHSWEQVDSSEDRGLLGEALYEMKVDLDGMLAHLQPGTTWCSTAYDEAGDGPLYTGHEDDLLFWAPTNAGAKNILISS
jgi:hypothetical protein